MSIPARFFSEGSDIIFSNLSAKLMNFCINLRPVAFGFVYAIKTLAARKDCL